MSSKLFLVLLLSCLVIGIQSRNPGFKARITSNGLKYANDVAIQALKTNVEKASIPDQSGSASGFKYTVKDIRVTQFTPPASSIVTVPGQGIQWKANNAYIALHGDFHYKKWFVSDDGSFDAKVSGVTFDLGINIGDDKTGRPSISTRMCSSSIGDVDFKFHGGMAWLYNLFRGKVGDVIKSSLKGQMCKLIDNEINVDGEKKMASLPVTTPLAKKFLLDYRLTQNPTFQTSYLETYHKGELFWLSDPDTESPLVPPAMPKNGDTENMLYLWISDYMFNTIGYVAQKHGYLKRNLTAQDLPKSSRDVLNTTCSGLIPCVGKLIPAIGEKYPNQVVDLRMNSTVAPNMTITPAGMNINCAGTIDLYARKPGATDAHFLVSLGATMSTSVQVSMENELLYAAIKDLNLKLKAGKSSIGPVSDAFLDFLINEALKVYLIPKLNDLGKKGFPLPVTKEFKFTKTKLLFAQDTVQVSTDLQYTPSSERVAYKPVDSDVLKFEPRVVHLR